MEAQRKARARTVLSINSQNPQMRLIRKATDVLRDGGIIIYPTDTVYGLGCDLSNKRGIEKIYEIKRRNKKRPLSFVCSDLKHISQYALVTDYAYKTMKRFLPGPYTFILEASRLVPRIILPKRPTTGIRVPDNQICLALIRELGQPIISTSVQTLDGEDLGDPVIINEHFGRVVDLIIDGGIIVPEPSSVVSLVDDRIEVLRTGKGDVSAFI
ncbi:MAG: L-threonylcarbamoyladenylate synthase [Smithellaceae bacterium]|jgi:tRNA threonylcarbamoyl adenosine modification protein (Sua5/YciO/YrdC/YwlC family)|nr:L-threonylcarbamoyladenylate synthase [Smithellaceae bacterium]MDD3258428.1 L-threonylcarbamoyladenylate synthase [Smithellaceae bacterium]MDD3847992.1 L-threonylcarbamoyladenylate synthase [Smithellaceae bacterium]HOG12894.1 L-threonylcarbamoyladenylate synthase [Smithellaceae bacterium]HOQ72454.1 L-threonylcarbamoyladenylate synthase [Smithellaceae bacterium]